MLQQPLRSINTLCNTLCMTVSTIGGGTPYIPQWDMWDRLNKSLRESGMSVADAAAYFDVHRNTVSGWLHGRINPDTRTLRLWAVMTGVPYEWIKDGVEPGGGGDGPHPHNGVEKTALTSLDKRRKRSDKPAGVAA
jgi:transcriptional regulator with XRE-family HTH domain